MRSLALAILMLLPAAAQDRWKIQFFHDEDNSTFQIRDIQFSSASRGIAVGVLLQKGKGPQGHSVVTSDAGLHWNPVNLKEMGESLFLLDDSHAWMVTEQGLWFSGEGGRDWKKISKQRGVERVWFLTPEVGWAVGVPKLFLKTTDGGKTWNKEQVVEQVDSTTEYTSFDWINFVDGVNGVVAGRSRPPRRRLDSKVPIWMDPTPSTRKELPSMTLLLQTADKGATWKAQGASLFGKITRIRASKTHTLALMEYDDFFLYPSELIRLDGPAGSEKRVYRSKHRLLTDIGFLPDESALAVGIEVQGEVSHSPVPGRVKVMRSSNLTSWLDMPVDYRASATRVSLAAVDLQHCWIATDSGMILKLERASTVSKQ